MQEGVSAMETINHRQTTNTHSHQAGVQLMTNLLRELEPRVQIVVASRGGRIRHGAFLLLLLVENNLERRWWWGPSRTLALELTGPPIHSHLNHKRNCCNIVLLGRFCVPIAIVVVHSTYGFITISRSWRKEAATFLLRRSPSEGRHYQNHPYYS